MAKGVRQMEMFNSRKPPRPQEEHWHPTASQSELLCSSLPTPTPAQGDVVPGRGMWRSIPYGMATNGSDLNSKKETINHNQSKLSTALGQMATRNFRWKFNREVCGSRWPRQALAR